VTTHKRNTVGLLILCHGGSRVLPTAAQAVGVLHLRVCCRQKTARVMFPFSI
jgi:hypothetical protein